MVADEILLDVSIAFVVHRRYSAELAEKLFNQVLLEAYPCLSMNITSTLSSAKARVFIFRTAIELNSLNVS
jgi:hypothetical protein